MNDPILEGARLSGQLEAGLLKACLTQTYSNAGRRDLEVVYTFPLPFHASITEVAATIGEKQLKGMVKAHREAEQDYEGAISKGDSAILIESAGNGLFTANLGNLRPGERFTVSMHFVQIIDWHHDQARLMFPTTIAPRYGNAQAQGKLPFHADTGTSVTQEYGFELDLLVRGLMARAALESPSHRISQTPEDAGGVRLRFRDSAFLDRDFVLRLHGLLSREGELLIESANDGRFALATFYPPLSLAQVRQESPSAESAALPSSPWQHPLRVKLLVDCSGSMAGDSIQSARKGIRALMDGLRDEDQIAVARFGSTLEHVLEKPKAAESETLIILKQWLNTLEADLGGTELKQALGGVFQSTSNQEPFDVLLITDGEIWDISATVERARSSGHRIFAIGVGSSPGESLLRQLAEQTGGAALFVHPNEDMHVAVQRLADMMSGPRVSGVQVTWSSATTLEALVSEHLHVGVPFRAVAMLRKPIGTEETSATLRYRIGKDAYSLSCQAAVLRQDLAVRYVVAQGCLARMVEEERRAFAERHQLLAQETAWILVHVREDDDKAEAVPALAQVPSMHAAGSLGFGGTQTLKQVAYAGEPDDVMFMGASVDSFDQSHDDVSLTRDLTAFRTAREYHSQAPAGSMRANIAAPAHPNLDIPAFLRRRPSKVDLRSVEQIFSRLHTVSQEVFQGLSRVHRMLSEQIHLLESVQHDMHPMTESSVAALLELWAEVTGQPAERLTGANSPVRMLDRRIERLARSREELTEQLEGFDQLCHLAAESGRAAREQLDRQPDQRTPSLSGQAFILTALLARLSDEGDLEALWDWVIGLKLPGLLAGHLSSLHQDQSLSKAQVVALFVLMLMDDGIGPHPNRRQMRLLKHVIRDLDQHQVESFKQILWDSADLAVQ